MGMLYIIGTPIGNLEDITLRALKVLKEVDTVLCEDTRVTKRLLDRYGLKKEMISYNAHATTAKTNRILNLLGEGKSVALVSDAGTPGISDPGSLLVHQVRESSPEVRIVAIPGPNALAAALSISGMPSSDFLFLGFLPHKKGRETLFKEIRNSKRTVVFYESPHRIMKTLLKLNEILEPDRIVGIAREISKVHEEYVSGCAGEVLQYYETEKDRVRGEFVVLVEGG